MATYGGRTHRGLIAGALLAALSVLVALAAVGPSLADGKTLRGTKKADRISGTAKKDVLRLRGGNDVGSGRKRADRILGGGGKDRLKGGGGGDKLAGGAKKDRLAGAKGKDRFNGGKGNDRLNAVDGTRDRRVNGGAGKNVCRIDDAELSAVKNCSEITSVDGGGDGGGGGGGGEPEGPGQKLELDSAEGLICDDARTACIFLLSGGGADTTVGTVTGRGGVTPGAGAGANAQDGEWTAAGGYRCDADGALVVTFAEEQVVVPVNCV